jgi:O-antigen/teichoic acid export membrane protein
MSGRTSTIGSDAVRTISFTLAGNVISFITGVVVAKTLGPAGKGALSGVQLLMNGLGSITSGAGAAITYMLTKRGQKMSDLIGTFSALLVCASMLLWLSLFIWGLFRGFTVAVYVVFAVVPAAVVLSWQGFFYIGLARVRNLNYQSLLLTLGTLVSIIVFVVVLHLGIPGALAGWALSFCIAATVVVVQAIQTAGRLPRLDFGQNFRDVVKFGSVSSFGSILAFLNLRVDSLILGAFLGVAGFGIYSVAVAAGEMLYLVSRALSTAISHDVGTLDVKTAGAITAKASRSSNLILGLLAIPLMIVGPKLITMIYGARFEPAGNALRILLPGIIVYSSGGPLSSFFVYQLGRPMVVTMFGIATIVIEAVLCTVLVPKLGLIGAALGSTTTYCCAAVLRTWFFSRTAHIPAAQMWVPQASDIATLKRFWREYFPLLSQGITKKT